MRLPFNLKLSVWRLCVKKGYLKIKDKKIITDLSSADLRYADLRSAKYIKFYSISGIGRENRQTLYLPKWDKVYCECFFGNLDEFEDQVKKTHADNTKYLLQYLNFIEYIKKCEVKIETNNKSQR